MAGEHVLVVEDDAAIGRGLSDALSAQGYEVQWATTGSGGLGCSTERQPDLVLLDLGLPDLDGIEVCRRLRAYAPASTIVILTARGEEIDVVVGLDAGADDYVTKPFRLTELLARVRAHLRRARPDDGGRVAVSALEVDSDARRAYVGGHELELRAKEFDLLALLAHEAGRAVTRERIMSGVWDEHWYGSTKTLDMHISSIRRKLAERDGAPRITTLRGVGYRLEER